MAEGSVMEMLKNTKDLFLQPDQVLPTSDLNDFKCTPISENANMVFLANGLSTPALKAAFNTLAKSHAEKKGKTVSNLKALVLWDSCFMFESVWSKDWKCTDKEAKNWNSSDVYHFDKFNNPLAADSKPFTKPKFMMEAQDGIRATTWTQDGDCEKQSESPNFQPYWCEDFGEVFSESGIGETHHLSLIDTLAHDDLKRALPGLNMPKWDYHRLTARFLNSPDLWDINGQPVLKLQNDQHLESLMNILDNYDIIAFDGGNPDMHRLGLSLAGENFRQKLKDKVSDSSLLYIGRSAGAIIASQDSITFEPNPALWYYFSFSKDSNIKDFWPLVDDADKDGLEGLSLIDCGIRPHFNKFWEPGVQGYVANNKRGSVRKVVRVRNDAGFFCTEGECVGVASASANFPFVRFDGPWTGARWLQAERLVNQHNEAHSPRSLQYGTTVHALKVRLIWLRLKGSICDLEFLQANSRERKIFSQKRGGCKLLEMAEQHPSDASEFAADDEVFDHEYAEDNPASLKYEDAIKYMMDREVGRLRSHQAI